MYFEFGQALQLGLDCVGDLTPDQGAIFGWIRHPAGQSATLRAEGGAEIPLPTLLWLVHPRPDVEAPPGMEVTGFTLIHGRVREAGGYELVVGLEGSEVLVDLMSYDLPADVLSASRNRDWSTTFQMIHASVARDAGRGLSPALLPWGEMPPVYAEWLDRLPRVSGGADAFMDLRLVAAVMLAEGDVLVSAGMAPAEGPGRPVSVTAFALIRDGGATWTAALPGPFAVLQGGFVAPGRVRAAPSSTVEVVMQVTRGEASTWFRAEAAPVGLPDYLAALSLAGVPLSPPDQVALHGWMREVLAARSAALRGPIGALGLAGGAVPPGATAVVFDLDEEYAARVLALMAPALERRFDRVVLSGSASGQAAAALMRHRIEVTVAADVAGAMEAAAAAGRPVAPIDMPSLCEAVIEDDPSRLAAQALPADGLRSVEALHGMIGMGGVETTLRRVLALAGGADVGALPMPGTRNDAVGMLVAEHLRELWSMVPVSRAAAR